MSKFFIKPRLVKPWFKTNKIVYDVQRVNPVWEDPTYGNGGGDYVDVTLTYGTFDSEQVAIDVINQMNKYTG